MTLREAVIKSLEEIRKPSTYMEIYNYIVESKIFDFGNSKTPFLSVSGVLTGFIQKSDTRIKRIKQENGSYSYYLTKNENNFELESNAKSDELLVEKKVKTKPTIKTYDERDLHKLLSSYLKNTETNSKTIYHELSNGKDNNQIWTHPDMIGIKFLNLLSSTSKTLLNSINRADTFKLSSYELKREINNDSELKKAYFQAVSNSSWANYGYLVAFEFSDSLNEEMARLNQSFGIGIIELNANPYQSKILYPSAYRNLDFKTIDKLCRINKEFEKFIELIEKLMTATEKYKDVTEMEFGSFCDKYFINDSEIEIYCKEKNIPFNDE